MSEVLSEKEAWQLIADTDIVKAPECYVQPKRGILKLAYMLLFKTGGFEDLAFGICYILNKLYLCGYITKSTYDAMSTKIEKEEQQIETRINRLFLWPLDKEGQIERKAWAKKQSQLIEERES
jgi:hypothetical protein